MDTPLAIANDGDTVKVNVQPIPAPTVKTFPPNNPPPDLDPKENAKTKANVKVEGGAFNASFDGTNLTITSVGEVTVSGTTEIMLPTAAEPPSDADKNLKDHEYGHDDLAKEEYNRSAKKKAEDAMRGFKGSKFKGEGKTPTERRDSALAKATADRDARKQRAQNGIFDQMNCLNTKYDDLTNHGKEGTTAGGKEGAKKERDQAKNAGTFLPIPDPRGALAATTGGVVSYDPLTGLLAFELSTSPIAVTSGGPLDPILGASVSLSPIQLIGVQTNGTMHLATSEINIMQMESIVLHGYLWELAYTPSSLPGFAGMIQGYLDIPPTFTGAGIDNVIGSGFLTQYQALLDDPDTVRRSTFWFFTDQALFDTAGNVLATSSTGVITFGAPEPSTLLLLCSGLALLRRRRK
jgi:hypothetical protein